MIVVLAADTAPHLIDLDRLDRLHVELHGPLDDADLGDLCRADDEDHVWLDVAEARIIGGEATGDPAFTEQFDAMIAYADRKGWLNETGTHVRAHIERPD